ncbi:MAG: DUF456 family protein [Desulfobacterales bacterium]
MILAGLAGLILPVIPGPVILLAGLVLAAWAENFVFIGPVVITVLTLLALLAHALDFIAGLLASSGLEPAGPLPSGRPWARRLACFLAFSVSSRDRLLVQWSAK